jgi:hypothetical protein
VHLFAWGKNDRWKVINTIIEVNNWIKSNGKDKYISIEIN